MKPSFIHCHATKRSSHSQVSRQSRSWNWAQRESFKCWKYWTSKYHGSARLLNMYVVGGYHWLNTCCGSNTTLNALHILSFILLSNWGDYF